MADDRVTRRRILAASVAAVASLSGCSAFGGAGTRGGPDLPVGGSSGGTTTAPPIASKTSGTASPNGTARTGTHSPGAETATATETPEPTATSPPSEQIAVAGTEITTGHESVTVGVDLKNTGHLTFSRIEIRVDLYHVPVGGSRRFVGHEYASFSGSTLGPGGTARLTTPAFESPLGGQVAKDTPTKRFDVDVAFRRVCTAGKNHQCFLPGETPSR
ncbi:MAG: hypothetical protein ABEJ28_12685 [Salinigranum sp.]